MQTINVQFTDATETAVKGYFGSPQDPVAWPNQGQITTTDARWTTFFDAQPLEVQQGLPASTAS